MKNPIYKPKDKAGEYAQFALNIYTGCNHGCVYCYAPRVMRKTLKDFKQVEPRQGLLDAMERQLSNGTLIGKTIHLCFTCDPYPAEIDTTITRQVIKLIKTYGGHVQILTKGGLRARRDFDLLDCHDWFGISITGAQTNIDEPKAAFNHDRIGTLAEANHKGIKTWISFEPVYHPETVYALIKDLNFVDLFKIGKLNYHPSTINWGEFGWECERLCKLHGRNYYIKEDLRKEMGINHANNK